MDQKAWLQIKIRALR